jgi:hypothetical protein
MSVHHFGWNRSYRQALEKLTRGDIDFIYGQAMRDAVTQTLCAAKLQFVADLYSIATIDEVMTDCRALRDLEKKEKT